MSQEILTDQATPHDSPTPFVLSDNSAPAIEIYEANRAIPDEVLADTTQEPEEVIDGDEQPAEETGEPQDPWTTIGIRYARIQRRRWRHG